MNHQYKVLCIGVNHVPVQQLIKRRLNYAEKDACTAAAYFETLKKDADVTCFTGKETTRTNILNWVEKCSAIEGQLNIVIFFSGHGSAEKNKDENQLERCLWIDSNKSENPKAHQLKTSEILKFLDNPLHHLIFIIDACYKFDGTQRGSIGTIFQQFKESERITQLKRYVIISASAVDQYTFEDPQLRHGVLTYYFLRTIVGKYCFSLQKKIPFVQLIALLDKRVRAHQFLTNTNRKLPLGRLMGNGIMAHSCGDDLQLPLLKPNPLSLDPPKKSFKQKISAWLFFLTSTRLKTGLFLMGGILVLLLLLLFTVNLTVVRIQFKTRHHVLYHHNMWGPSNFYLNGLSTFNLRKKPYQEIDRFRHKEFNFYLFRFNWVTALQRRLNDDGKIRLLGDLLGLPITGVPDKKLLQVGLGYQSPNFYWHPDDLNRFLRILVRELDHLRKGDKENALRILAQLGQKGKNIALEIVDLKKEINPTGSEADVIDDLKPEDYLYSNRLGKKFSHSLQRGIQKKFRKYLQEVAQRFPDLDRKVTNSETLAEIYENLEILAAFGSSFFQSKAAQVFNKNFDPEKFLPILSCCKHFEDSLWMLQQYFIYLEQANITKISNYQWQIIDTFIDQLPVPQQSQIRKMLLDNIFLQIPERTRKFILGNCTRLIPALCASVTGRIG